jgi:Ca2+-binding EF-hand superfamily protein
MITTVLLATAAVTLAAPAAPPPGADAKPDPFGVDTPLPDVVASLIDSNQDGAVDDAEAAAAVSQLPKIARTKTPLGQAVLVALDANKNRRLSEQEARDGVLRAREHARGVASEVRAVFDKLDQNGDERISVVEFRGLVTRLGVLGQLIAPKLSQFFNGMDVNRDGMISPAESQRGADFLVQQIELEKRKQALAAKLRDPRYHRAAQLVSSLDRNKDQQISEREASRNKDVREAFVFVDTNADQQLSVDECYEHLKSLAAAQKKLQGEAPR